MFYYNSASMNSISNSVKPDLSQACIAAGVVKEVDGTRREKEIVNKEPKEKGLSWSEVLTVYIAN